MKLSTKGRYGTRALLDMARHYGQGPLPLRDIAERQQIPLQYLERLMGPLTRGGLIHSVRGVKGGVWLARSPQEIKLSQVVEAMEGDIVPVSCVGDPDLCGRSGECATRDVWTEVQDAVHQVLEGITLADLMERQTTKEHPSRDSRI